MSHPTVLPRLGKTHPVCFAGAVARPLRTSDLRPATGLDEAARSILLRMLTDCGVREESIHNLFLRSEHYADLEDYLGAVATVWGGDVSAGLLRRILEQDNAAPTRRPILFRNQSDAGYSAAAFFNAMPEPDFLTCIEGGHLLIRNLSARAGFPESANRLCERRGIPYRLQGSLVGVWFVWTGDPTIEREALQPAVSALADPRLAPGPGQELAAARRGLREGTPAALRRSVAQACNAVESTLKVLLTEHGWPIPSGHGVDALLGACRAAELLPPAAEEILAGPARFANRRGDHDVERDEAEAAMAAAAVASKFIAGRLPDPPASGAGE